MHKDILVFRWLKAVLVLLGRKAAEDRYLSRKRAECGLQAGCEAMMQLAQQQRLSDLLEQDIVGVAQADALGCYTLVNDRYCAILGRERSNLLGRRHADATHPENRALLEQLHDRVLQEKRHFVVEHSFLRVDDRPYWLQLAVTVHLDANGTVDSYMVLAFDITERRQQERTWRQTAEILTVAERAASAGAWRWDCLQNQAEWSS